MDRLKVMLQWAGLLHFLWCFVIQVVLEFINCTTVTNRDLILYQLFYNELEPATAFYRPNLKVYKAIGSHCKVLILLEKRPKVYKVKAKTESEKLLTVLKSKNCLVYISTKNIVTKMPFLKLYEPKNPLLLEGVSKFIGIRPLNDVSVIQDSIGKKVSLNLPEIDNDDIGSPEPVEPLALGPSRFPEPLALGPLEPIVIRLFKPLELENRPIEEPIKPINSSNLDEMQLDLVTSFCYRIKAKIFKKKLNKNSFTPNMYKQALKSPNVKEWLTVTFSEFKQLISLETLKFLLYEALFKCRKPLTN